MDEDDEYDDQSINPNNASHLIPWYMIHEEGKFFIFWQMCFALTVFFNFLYAPFVTGFPAFRETYISSLKVVEYTIEIFWACSIFVNFMLASTEMKIFYQQYSQLTLYLFYFIGLAGI